MAEWENVPLDPTTKRKKQQQQRVNLEPRRPMAARLITIFTAKGMKVDTFICFLIGDITGCPGYRETFSDQTGCDARNQNCNRGNF